MLRLIYSKKYLPLVFVLLVTCLVYSPILSNDFLYSWDDQWMVMNRYTEQGWTLNNLWHIFTDFYNGQYGPLTELNYLFIYSFVGYTPWTFHLASLLWHLGCVYLVWKFISTLLRMNGNMIESDICIVSFITTFLFAIHPVNVEAIAWISAVKVLIYGFFYLLGLLFYLKYLETRSFQQYVYVIICFVISFLGKEQAVTFSLMLLLIDWFVHRDLKDELLWYEKFPFFVLAIFFGFVTILSQGAGGGKTTFPLLQRLVFLSYSIVEYLTKSLLPVKLNYLYPFPIIPGEKMPVRFYIYPLICICMLAWLYIYRKNKYILFGVILFTINLMVSIHIIPMSRHAIVADRYMYLSYIGIAFLLSYWVDILFKNGIVGKKTLILCFIIYGVYFMGYTCCYSHRWENTIKMKEYIKELIENRFDYIGHSN